MAARRRSFGRIGLVGLGGLLGLCLLAVAASAVSNFGLPERSQTVDRLAPAEKARLIEVTHLRQTLGDDVWPGWAHADIPVIVYNEEYAFLAGHPDPPSGWTTVPKGEARGTAWEAVPGDDSDGAPYYRQRLAGPEVTPQAFIVLVGGRPVASMETLEYSEVGFYRGFREQIPPLLRPIFPYRLAWGLLMGESENYVATIEHEAFHALEQTIAPARLAAAENAGAVESGYPWNDAALERAWQEETDLLVQAVQAQDDGRARELARQFLARRTERRAMLRGNPEFADFERQREWEEGLAKYADVAIRRAPARTPGYAPVPALSADPRFKGYANSERFYAEQLAETGRLANREGETRLYYTGMAQAVLLDRFMPNWKARIMAPGVMQEDLLAEAVR